MTFKNIYHAAFKNMGKDSASDWYRALTLLVMALLVMLAVNIFFYIRFTHSQEFTSESTGVNTIILKQSDISNAIKNIKQHDTAISNIPGIVLNDPSF